MGNHNFQMYSQLLNARKPQKSAELPSLEEDEESNPILNYMKNQLKVEEETGPISSRLEPMGHAMNTAQPSSRAIPKLDRVISEDEKILSGVNVDINSIMSQGLNADTARDLYLMGKESEPMLGMNPADMNREAYSPRNTSFGVQPAADVPKVSTDLGFMDKIKLAFTSGNPEDYETKDLKGFSLNEAQKQNYSEFSKIGNASDASGQSFSLPAMNNFKDTAINLKEKFAQENAMANDSSQSAMANDSSQTDKVPQSFLDMMAKGASSLGGGVNSVARGVDKVGGAFLSSLFGIEEDENVGPAAPENVQAAVKKGATTAKTATTTSDETSDGGIEEKKKVKVWSPFDNPQKGVTPKPVMGHKVGNGRKRRYGHK